MMHELTFMPILMNFQKNITLCDIYVTLWNSLPLFVRQAATIDSSKRSWKPYLFTKTYK